MPHAATVIPWSTRRFWSGRNGNSFPRKVWCCSDIWCRLFFPWKVHPCRL